MKFICNDDQRIHLLKLTKLIKDKQLTGTDAWTLFSSNKKVMEFKNQSGQKRQFISTLTERKAYKAMRASVEKKLYEDNNGFCSYCCRPVGHYGFSWHIEHVMPKSRFPSKTFKLANLTIGCVDCNRWKGARVDSRVTSKFFPIINPSELGFNYSNHLHYLQFSTEKFSFAKYTALSSLGKSTYANLNFHEIERAHLIDRLDGLTSQLHARFQKVMSPTFDGAKDPQLLKLLAGLKSAIYSKKR